MPIEYQIDRKNQIIFSKGVGCVTLQELLEYGEEIARMPESLEGFVEYVDFREITDLAVSYQTARQMDTLYKQWKARGILGAIIFAPHDFSFGITRMIGTVVATVNQQPEVHPTVVREPMSVEEIRTFFR